MIKKIILLQIIFLINTKILLADIDYIYIESNISMAIVQNPNGTTSLTASTYYDFNPYCDAVFGCYDWKLFKDDTLLVQEDPASFCSTKMFTVTESGKYVIMVVYKRKLAYFGDWYIYIDKTPSKSVLNCQVDATITGVYASFLTQSSTWIKSSGTTTILSSANVKLDADPANGYVLLQPTAATDFFLSAPTASGVFIAQALDGCGAAIPSFAAPQNLPAEITVVQNSPTQAKAITNDEKNTNEAFTIYPNPAKKSFTLVSKNDLKNATVQLVDMLGKAQPIVIKDMDSYSKKIEWNNISKGIYMVIINTANKREVKKIIIE